MSWESAALRWRISSSVVRCQNAAKVHAGREPEPAGPHVSDIIDKVQCEILLVVDDGKTSQGPLANLRDGELYVANVDLTPDFTNSQAATTGRRFKRTRGQVR